MSKNHLPFSDHNSESGGRYYLLFWGMVFLFMMLGARLWYLQVIRGEELHARTISNRTAMVEIVPVRGLILDRNDLMLVNNEASFDVYVNKMEVKDAEKLLVELAVLTRRPFDDLMVKYTELPRTRQAQPLVTGLNRGELVAVESHRYRLEGVSIQVSTNRRPLTGVLAAHTIGYLRQISQKQLEREKERFEEGLKALIKAGESSETAREMLDAEYRPHNPGDLVGQGGIEQGMEYYLQGRRGKLRREIDSRGRVLNEVVAKAPEHGHTIRLTLDSRLQAVAQSLLGERAGSIVVMDPRSFEILALASSPTYSLDDFVGSISRERWQSLMNDPFHPLLHRAVGGKYAPGSTYKIVVALAALSEGVITPEETINCTGSYQLGTSTFRCHSRMGHGPMNLKQSLKHSCDVYYYEVGRRMGTNRIAQVAREFFGLGRKMGLELPSESPGTIPDSDWLMSRYKKQWLPGDTMSVSIGQGYIETTPLEVAQYTAVLANGGKLYRPHLVKDIVDVEGNVVKSFEPELISEIKVNPAYIKAVKNGLEAVVNEPGGTGRRAALPDITVAGKTGTSQVVSLKRFQSHEKVPYKDRDHAWFSGYAPAENPEVVVAVLLEHSGGGGANAAPVARQILAAYFDKSIVAEYLPPPQVQPDQLD